MSFRKRSVKPNLFASKRKSSLVESKETTKEDVNDTVHTSTLEQTSTEGHANINEVVSLVIPNIKEENVCVKTEEKLPSLTVPTTIDTTKSSDLCENKHIQSSKKLSKRVKLAPKLTARNSPRPHHDTKEPPDKLPMASIETLQNNTLQTNLNLKCSQSTNNLVKSSHTGESIVTCEKSSKVNGDTTIEIGKRKLSSESVDDVVVEPVETTNSEPRTTSPVKDSIQNPKEDTQKSNGNRLQKRVKVTPKLSKSNLARGTNRTSRIADSQSVKIEKESIASRRDIEVKHSPELTTTAVQNTSTSEQESVVLENTKTSVVSTKLSKRTKIKPTLAKSPTTSRTSLTAHPSNTLDDKGPNESMNTIISSNISPACTKTEDNVDTYEDFETSHPVTDSLSSENIQTKTSPMENILENDQKVKEKRRVHFTEDNIDSDDSCNNIEFDARQQQSRVSKSVISDSGEKNVENPSKTLDDIDASSQSESEISSKIVLSKKKTFKPNLDARRRKRLSSFSAYSSCDEEEDETSKKKKKGTKEVNNVSSSTKKKKKTGKNRKQKTSKTEKHDDEQEEDETSKKTKDKTKKSGTRIFKPKVSEEKDLSSLTMQELIYYRPKSFKTVELKKSKKDPNDQTPSLETVVPDIVETKATIKKQDESQEDVVAPQIMINEDGEIVINEESLTLKKKIDDSALKNSGVLYEDALSYGSNLRRKINRGKRWTLEETLRFYKALSQIGTDFTLMSQAFGRFTRNELKKKFKQEERVNCDLVDRALANRLPLNMDLFLRGKQELRDFLEESKAQEEGEENNNKKELTNDSDCEEGEDGCQSSKPQVESLSENQNLIEETNEEGKCIVQS